MAARGSRRSSPRVLRQRLITAVILVPLVVWGVISLPTSILAVIVALIIGMGAWEWGGLLPRATGAARGAYTLLAALCLVPVWAGLHNEVFLAALLGVTLLWWCYALARMFILQEVNIFGVDGRTQGTVATVIAGLLVLVPAWGAVVAMHGAGTRGPYYVLLLLVLIWGADSGAYFAGRAWGSRKLAPRISPGKTWEGVAGALVTVAVLAITGGYLLDLSADELMWFVPLSLVTAIFSIGGDLLESAFKRMKGVKDSGDVLPGHGGVLDRIDSLTAAAPVFMLGLTMLGLVN